MKNFWLLIVMTSLVSARAAAQNADAPGEETQPPTSVAEEATAPQQAAQGSEAETGEKAASEQPVAVSEGAPFEEITAAPAATGQVVEPTPATPGQATPGTTPTASGVSLDGLSAQQRELAVQRSGGPRLVFIFDNSLGSGGFMSNSSLRSSNALFSQSLSLRPAYTFNWLDKSWVAGASFNFTYEYTTPNNDLGRSWSTIDGTVSLSQPNVITDPFLGIRVAAGVRWTVPSSTRSLMANKMYSGLGGNIGLFRSVGPFDFSYGFSANKFFNAEKISVTASNYARSTDPVLSGGKGDPVLIAAGNANTSFLLNNSASITYNFDDYLTATYQVTIMNGFNYAVADEVDAYTAIHAQPGMGRFDQISAVLDVSYEISRSLERVFGPVFPFRTILSAGLFTWTPAQTADNEGIMWPIFVNSFGANRAATNYGTVYFDIIGVIQ